jgi:hypothetical protein
MENVNLNNLLNRTEELVIDLNRYKSNVQKNVVDNLINSNYSNYSNTSTIISGNKCLRSNNDTVELWDCDNSQSQQFQYDGQQIIANVFDSNSNSNSNPRQKCFTRVLNPNATNTSTSEYVVLKDCANESNQIWNINGNQITSLSDDGNNQCLDVPSFDFANGTVPIIYDCDGSSSQIWRNNFNSNSNDILNDIPKVLPTIKQANRQHIQHIQPIIKRDKWAIDNFLKDMKRKPLVPATIIIPSDIPLIKPDFVKLSQLRTSGILAFDGKDFTGRQVFFKPGQYLMESAEISCIGSNNIASIVVGPLTIVYAYQDDNFQGASYIFRNVSLEYDFYYQLPSEIYQQIISMQIVSIPSIFDISSVYIVTNESEDYQQQISQHQAVYTDPNQTIIINQNQTINIIANTNEKRTIGIIYLGPLTVLKATIRDKSYYLYNGQKDITLHYNINFDRFNSNTDSNTNSNPIQLTIRLYALTTLNSGRVTFFQDCNFTGLNYIGTTGSYDADSDLIRTIGSENISSMIIGPRTKIQLMSDNLNDPIDITYSNFSYSEDQAIDLCNGSNVMDLPINSIIITSLLDGSIPLEIMDENPGIIYQDVYVSSLPVECTTATVISGGTVPGFQRSPTVIAGQEQRLRQYQADSNSYTNSNIEMFINKQKIIRKDSTHNIANNNVALLSELPVDCGQNPLTDFTLLNMNGKDTLYYDYGCDTSVETNNTPMSTEFKNFANILGLASLDVDCGNSPITGFKLTVSNQGSKRYDYTCGDIVLTDINDYVTNAKTANINNINGLSGQKISCNPGYLSRFKLNRNYVSTVNGNNLFDFSYHYSCGIPLVDNSIETFNQETNNNKCLLSLSHYNYNNKKQYHDYYDKESKVIIPRNLDKTYVNQNDFNGFDLIIIDMLPIESSNDYPINDYPKNNYNENYNELWILLIIIIFIVFCICLFKKY